MRRPSPPALLLLAALGFAAPAWAAEGDAEVRVRAATHPDFGRIVFDFPELVRYRLTREGGTVRVSFEAAGAIGSPARLPRNVLGVAGGEGQAEIAVAPGVRIRPMRVGTMVVIDVLDPEPAKPKPPAPAAGSLERAGDPSASADGRAEPSRAARAAPASASLPPAPGPAANAAHAPSEPRRAEPERPGPVAASDGAPARDARPTKPEVGPAPGQAVAPASGQAVAPAPDQVEAPPRPGRAALAVAEPPPAPPPVAASPLAIAAQPLPPPAGVGGSAAVLPFSADTGAAAFRRNDWALLVFDERRPIDLAALRDDPILSSAAVQLLPAATVIRMRMPLGAGLSLSRAAEGWAVAVGPFVPTVRPIAPVLADRRITLAADTPGQAVSVADPDTGGVLLVGTQRGAGQGTAVARRTSEFVLLPTWQGVALEPLADRVVLRVATGGFVLGAEPDGLALLPPAADDLAYAGAVGLTRRYDFPPLPTDRLMQRLQAEIDAVASAPPLARGRKRREAAQTMLALGLGAEAQSMLTLAVADDPREADDPDTIGLGAIAALLAGREGEAEGLADPRLSGTDEITLWRAALAATQSEGSPKAAPAFAATLPLLLSYPSGLRDRLLPLAAETMALNKLDEARGLLAARPDDPALALARGLALETTDDRDGALAVYDRLTASPNRLTRARAAARAVELRLASGALDARQAADALEKQIYAWRGGRREEALRLRIADLRARSGSGRAALALLRESEAMWSDDRAMIHERMQATMAGLLSEPGVDRLSPIDLIALVEENADLIPDAERGAELAGRLADRLLALDLPKRADAVLARLVQSTSGVARATVGVRLAELRLREDDPRGANDGLAASTAEGVPEAIEQRRGLAGARATARLGDLDAAVRLLAGIGTAAADEARASLLEQAKRWPEAASALAAYVDKTVPASGPLDEAQRRTLLRLAGAVAQSGDGAALEQLRVREAKRMAGGPFDTMFRLLTARPVQGGADLPRVGREIALARALPGALRELDAPRPRP